MCKCISTCTASWPDVSALECCLSVEKAIANFLWQHRRRRKNPESTVTRAQEVDSLDPKQPTSNRENDLIAKVNSYRCLLFKVRPIRNRLKHTFRISLNSNHSPWPQIKTIVNLGCVRPWISRQRGRSPCIDRMHRARSWRERLEKAVLCSPEHGLAWR